MTEEWVSHPDMRRNSPTQVARPQNHPEHRCSRNQVEDQASDLDEAERDDHALRISELRGRLNSGTKFEHLDRSVERQEQNRESAQQAARPERLRRDIGAQGMPPGKCKLRLGVHMPWSFSRLSFRHTGKPPLEKSPL